MALHEGALVAHWGANFDLQANALRIVIAPCAANRKTILAMFAPHPLVWPTNPIIAEKIVARAAKGSSLVWRSVSGAGIPTVRW